MTDRWRWVVPLFAVFLAAGCTTATTGKRRSGAERSAASMGSLIQRGYRSTALRVAAPQPFQKPFTFPPVFGAATDLSRNSDVSARPR